MAVRAVNVNIALVSLVLRRQLLGRLSFSRKNQAIKPASVHWRVTSIDGNHSDRKFCTDFLDNMSNTVPRNEKGEFVRAESAFRKWVSADGSSGFPPEAGRYHLYVSYACPFAARTLIGRALKGLESAISITVVDPHLELGGKGWSFSDQDPDVVNGKATLREVYQIAQPDYSGRVSVPVLWDKKQKTIVNNESAEILRMMGTGVFNEFCATPEQKALDLYPEHLRAEIDEMNEFVYPNINNGVYRAGFAASQEAYEKAVNDVFNALDKLEERFDKQRYLVGNTLTEADVRLVTTLLRFDVAYHGLFKCNKRSLVQYPNISAYTRDIYQQPGVAPTLDLAQINTHYWWSLNTLNPSRIVPLGPEPNFNAPHNRDRFEK